jgi:hypothetical protein
LRQRSLQKGKSSSVGRTSIPQVGHFINFADFFFAAMDFAWRAMRALSNKYRSARSYKT